MPAPQTEVLITVDGVERGRHVLAPGDYVIGRNADCHICVDADLVSRQHAKLILNYDNALIEDLGSSNGTLVNDEPVTGRTRLWPSQKIRIGAATITLRRVQGEAPTDMSLAPAQQAIRRMLPAEMLREKKYDIGAVVARGGMGAILDAREAAIKRKVAMKVMLDTNDADDISRFVAEAQVTGQLEHPNIVPVHELGVDENGQPFYTMQMVRGITLKKVLELLAKGVAETVQKFPLSALLTVFQKVCDAIAFAHSKGVIHRDLKPENLMLGDFGSVLVMDWGLAKVLDPTRAAASVAPGQDLRSIVHTAPGDANTGSMTLVGTIMGTPQYMAPEQARGEIETLDARTDIYALGAILFHILFLRAPVSGGDAMQVVGKVARGEVEWPAPKELRAVPDSLLAVCRKALALDPATRYPHVEDLQADILAYQNGFATSAEKAGLGKQIFLAAKRHKAASIGIAAVLLVGSVFGTKAIIEGRRAERGEALAKSETVRAKNETARAEREAAAAKVSLENLRRTAPTFYDQAKLLTEREELPEALEKIDIALSLTPGDASFHAQRGNILQSMERFADAANAYGAALRLNPQDATAKANVELSQALAEEKFAGELTNLARLRWRDALAQQGRNGEAILAGRGAGATIASDNKKMLSTWQAKVNAWLGKDAPKITIRTDGYYKLDLSARSITDLSPLKGMPLRELKIDGNPHVKDLNPLAKCPLGAFSAEGVTDLSDLSPLREMSLRTCFIGETGVTNLEPLTAMRSLVELRIRGVSDLAPIKDAKLETLVANSCRFSTLEPLRGHPLRSITLHAATVPSLEPLADAPINNITFRGCNRMDLAALKSRKLRSLDAYNTEFDHLEILAEMQDLEWIALPKNMTDPSILRILPRLRKINPANVNPPYLGLEKAQDAADFWKEYDAKQAAQKK